MEGRSARTILREIYYLLSPLLRNDIRPGNVGFPRIIADRQIYSTFCQHGKKNETASTMQWIKNAIRPRIDKSHRILLLYYIQSTMSFNIFIIDITCINFHRLILIFIFESLFRFSCVKLSNIFLLKFLQALLLKVSSLCISQKFRIQQFFECKIILKNLKFFKFYNFLNS